MKGTVIEATDAAATNPYEPKRPTGVTSLGQTDFLKLLTAQLKNQDPTSPVDNAQFVSQLSQFSMVNGIETLNTGVSALGTRLAGSEVAAAASLVGRTVLAPASAFAPGPDGFVRAAVELPDAVEGLTITVSDARGREVRRLALGPHRAGLIRFEWDGVDDAGHAVPPGRVTLAAEARAGSVTTRPVIYAHGAVTGAVPGSGGAGTRVEIEGAGEVPVTNLRSIR